MCWCMQTVHVTLNARTEADIDEDDIVKRVAKSSGANYSFHKEKAKDTGTIGPVVSKAHLSVVGLLFVSFCFCSPFLLVSCMTGSGLSGVLHHTGVYCLGGACHNQMQKHSVQTCYLSVKTNMVSRGRQREREIDRQRQRGLKDKPIQPKGS